MISHLASKVIITIGNFCGGIKSYDNISLLAKRKGINPTSINFFRFRGNGQPGSMLIKDNSGRATEVPYPTIRWPQWTVKTLAVSLMCRCDSRACRYCLRRCLVTPISQQSASMVHHHYPKQKADDVIAAMIRDRIITVEPDIASRDKTVST